MKNEIRNHEYENRINRELAKLGIAQELIAQKQLPFYLEAQELAIGETDADGREYMMTPATAAAWAEMKAAALQDNVDSGSRLCLPFYR